ncbi:MAG: O-antigen ligase family protein [Acidimicrobiales bacterium]
MSAKMSHRVERVTSNHSSAGSRWGPALLDVGPPERARPLEIFAAVVAAVLPVAISPIVYSYTFTPKLAILLVVAAVGMPRLVALAFGSERAAPARAALVFLAVALAASLHSPATLLAFFGSYGWGTGWIFWCGVMGAFAIGASLGDRGRELVATGLLVGAGVNAVVEIFQEALRLNSPVLGLYQGTQADGLMGNPTFLESILVGALALTLARSTLRSPGWLALAALLAAGLELSGERFALVLLAALAVYALAAVRTRRALVFVIATGVGYGAAYVSTSRLLRQRITASVASNPRTLLWRSLAHALRHHLLLGFGPGGTMAAQTRYGSLALARKLEVGTYFADAHDILIEVAVTTGFLGLFAFASFGYVTLRKASGPLLGFTILAVAVELIEPLNVGVTPLIFLALGGAVRCHSMLPASQTARVELTVRSLVSAVVLVAASIMLVGDYEVNQGLLHYDFAQAQKGSTLLRIWAQPAALTANVADNRSIALSNPTLWLPIARHWRAIAVQREPTNTQLWEALADSDVAIGHDKRAITEYAEALDLNSYNTDALVFFGQLELELGHRSKAITLLQRAVASAPGDPTAAQALTTATNRG